MWPTSAHVRASLALGVAADAGMRAGDLSLQQLCDCVSGVAMCGLLDKALMHQAARILAREAASLSQEQICDVAAAYARTGTSSPELFAHLAGAAHMRLQQGSVTAAQATILAWAFSIHGTASTVTISHLFNAIVVRSKLPPRQYLLLSCNFLSWKAQSVYSC